MAAFHLDLVGAYPCSRNEAPTEFYRDIVLRTVTTVSTRDVNQHEMLADTITEEAWRQLRAPAAMVHAAQQLGKRNFFTAMVRIADLVSVPSVSDVVASQYSEGCFSTWEPSLNALITTVTGSARPVDKGHISDDELSVVVGVREDGLGVRVRPVQGKQNSPPSSEALEMLDMDSALPTVMLGPGWDRPARVPVARSKLHGHRGIAGFDPRFVEYVPLDAPYFHYIVSCGTDAQSRGIRAAFARSEALRNQSDPRQVVFTVLPGHGTVVVERWVPGTVPFQTIWEYMDAGYLRVESCIPQGPMEYVAGPGGIMSLRERPTGFPRL